MSAIFCHDEEQKALAIETRDRRQEQVGKIHTKILPASTFYQAEDYHQKYYLRGSAIFKGYLKLFPDPKDLVPSTVAARLNGFAGRHATIDQLRTEFERLGLSPEARTQLLRLASGK
jgi:peptide-methionine (S)-S-oxide reductase